MMTPEELAEELKSLHYTEKLVLAQKLIEYAYDELGQLSQQIAPRRASVTATISQERGEVPQEQEPAAEEESELQENAEQESSPQPPKAAAVAPKVPSSAKNKDEIISFNDLVSRLQTQKCKKEATLINAIINLYQYRGEISQKDAKKIITRLKQKKVISIDEKGTVSWN